MTILGLEFQDEGRGRYSVDIKDIASWLSQIGAYKFEAGRTQEEHRSLLALFLSAVGSSVKQAEA